MRTISLILMMGFSPALFAQSDGPASLREAAAVSSEAKGKALSNVKGDARDITNFLSPEQVAREAQAQRRRRNVHAGLGAGISSVVGSVLFIGVGGAHLLIKNQFPGAVILMGASILAMACVVSGVVLGTSSLKVREQLAVSVGALGLYLVGTVAATWVGYQILANLLSGPDHDVFPFGAFTSTFGNSLFGIGVVATAALGAGLGAFGTSALVQALDKNVE